MIIVSTLLLIARNITVWLPLPFIAKPAIGSTLSGKTSALVLILNIALGVELVPLSELPVPDVPKSMSRAVRISSRVGFLKISSTNSSSD